MADQMPTEKMDSAKILGTFTFKPLDDVAWCNTEQCGYRSPTCPDCCGGVTDEEFCLCWPFIVNTGCRHACGAKFITIETCVKAGGFNLCIAQACAFPPDDAVPIGCGCCGAGAVNDVTLDGMGLDFKNDTSLHSVCLCYHCGCYTDFPKCCGAHQSGTVCCFTILNHCALDPIETCFKTRASHCCVEQKQTSCPKPCWPCCMFQDEAICC